LRQALGCGFSLKQQHDTQEIEVECSNRYHREGKIRGIHILYIAGVIQEVLISHETRYAN